MDFSYWPLITSFGAFAIAFALIVALRKFWTLTRGLDAGDGQRKTQEKPVLRVAGIALYAAFLFGFLLIHWSGAGAERELPWIAFVLLGSVLFFTGLLDDLFTLPASLRLLIQVVVGVSAYLYGMRIETFTHPFTGETTDLGGFALVITVGWFVALPNLINFIDGLDGLAGGIGLFLSITLAVLGQLTGNPCLLILSLAMIGGLTAFLCFNLPPAKVYMGDGGAYLLGYFIAATSLITSNKASIFGALLVVVIALGFPILDTAFTLVRRFLSGLPLMQPDARHLHHRLMTLGFSKRTIIMMLYGVFASLSILGLSTYISGGYVIPIAGMFLTVTVLFGMRKLGLPHTFSEAKERLSDVIAARKDTRYSHALSQTLEHEVDRASTKEEFWAEVSASLRKLGITPAFADGHDQYVCEVDHCLIVHLLPDNRAWRLCCPDREWDRKHWRRIAACFLPALLDGEARWGSAPEFLGVIPHPPGKSFPEWENDLNKNLLHQTPRST